MSKMIVNIAIFGAFALVVAVFGFFLWQTLFASEENGDAESQPKITYGQKQAGNENPLRAGSTPSITNGTDKAIARYTKWLAIFTLFLVLATVGLFISGERAVQVGNRSAIAANNSAKAARDAADIAQKTLEASLRPFIFVKSFEVQTFTNVLQISPQYENSGNSPTNNMRAHINWRAFAGEIPVDFKYPDYNVDGNIMTTPDTDPAFVGPRATSYGGAIYISVNEIDKVREKKQRIFVWGWIEYDDITPETPRHRTEFCSELIVVATAQIPATVPGNIVQPTPETPPGVTEGTTGIPTTAFAIRFGLHGPPQYRELTPLSRCPVLERILRRTIPPRCPVGATLRRNAGEASL